MTDNNNKSVLNNASSGVGGMEYNFREIEKKWQQQWKETNAYKVSKRFSQTKILCAGYVSLSKWCRIACGASAGLYRQ